MTFQTLDNFMFHGAVQIVVDTSHGQLFPPMSFGMFPQMATTGCWRGYHAVFAVRDGRLLLQDLRINLLREGRRIQGPDLNGLTPSMPPEPKTIDDFRYGIFSPFSNHYDGVNLPLRYDGGVLIANRGSIRPGTVGGPLAPWSLHVVTELVFEQGLLQREIDRSDVMQALRDMEDAGQDVHRPDARMRAFIRRSFDCAYSF